MQTSSEKRKLPFQTSHIICLFYIFIISTQNKKMNVVVLYIRTIQYNNTAIIYFKCKWVRVKKRLSSQKNSVHVGLCMCGTETSLNA